eukprot:m.67594 g.67594  ORF g.67594 m.67594 type:complete len:280 (-) comp13837_c1_seq3:26-865(-)
MTKLERIRLATDEDFGRFRELTESQDGFELKYNKKGVQVYAKLSDDSPVKIIKVHSEFNCAASVVYDLLHDDDYRKTWDKFMKASFIHCHLDATNDICYYCTKMPGPIANRDLVFRRSWKVADDESEYMILNSSCHHRDLALDKKNIRAISLISGFRLIPKSDKSCMFTYVTHADPRGSLPKWLVNTVATSSGPKLIATMQKAASTYASWKQAHRPDFKPWRNPEQLTTPLLPASEWDAVQEGADEEDAAADAAAAGEADVAVSQDAVTAELDGADDDN